jgi:hypothetical protein
VIDVGSGSRDAASAVVLDGALIVAAGPSDAAGGVDFALATTSTGGGRGLSRLGRDRCGSILGS